jgi:hypothetical protein
MQKTTRKLLEEIRKLSRNGALRVYIVPIDYKSEVYNIGKMQSSHVMIKDNPPERVVIPALPN